MILFIYILNILLKDKIKEPIYHDFFINSFLYKSHILFFIKINKLYSHHPLFEDLQLIYIKAQKTYHFLRVFSKIYKFKSYKHFSCDTTLSFNKNLNDISQKYKIQLVHNKTIYNFYIFDLQKIWCSALTNNTQLIVNPLHFKNPYNNMEFTYLHMFQIYFKLLYTNTYISSYVQNFFKYSFDVLLFKMHMFTILKDNAVNCFLKSGNYDLIYSFLINLNNDFAEKMNSFILEDLKYIKNKKKIFILLRDELEFYLKYKYASNVMIEQFNYKLLCNILKCFHVVQNIITDIMNSDRLEFLREHAFAMLNEPINELQDETNELDDTFDQEEDTIEEYPTEPMDQDEIVETQTNISIATTGTTTGTMTDAVAQTPLPWSPVTYEHGNNQ